MIGADRRYDGPMGKSDRAAVLGGLALWIGAGLPMSPLISNLVLKMLSLLLALTIYNRVRAGIARARVTAVSLKTEEEYATV
jgi:CDP-diacylglycerol--glycerol-3-phosphate 3-phosphatidyltransferase